VEGSAETGVGHFLKVNSENFMKEGETMFYRKDIRQFELGIVYDNGIPIAVLGEGRHWLIDFSGKKELRMFDIREPLIDNHDYDLLRRSGLIEDYILDVDLKDNQRGLLWIDGRFSRILGPGRYAFWKNWQELSLELVNVSNPRFEHGDTEVIAKAGGSQLYLEQFNIAEGHEGLYFLNGKLIERLEPGKYLFWKNIGTIKLYHKDLREKTVDVSGQDIMTSDKVTLRLNAVLSYRIIDALKTVLSTENLEDSLYKEAQLSLRSVIGTMKLEDLLISKDEASEKLLDLLNKAAKKLGAELVRFGIKDLILPGDMREILNKVTEAQKNAEANLIFRREEVAAMRSQANTAKMLADNPALMRLKELEVLEKITAQAKLNIVLGGEKISEKVINLI
jgi:regulator of protease activity HflC (stomatin/prohibitin superfamily)